MAERPNEAHSLSGSLNGRLYSRTRLLIPFLFTYLLRAGMPLFYAVCSFNRFFFLLAPLYFLRFRILLASFHLLGEVMCVSLS